MSPTSATVYVNPSAIGSLWVPDESSRQLFRAPVQAPFHHVAVHVVQSPRIGQLHSHPVSLLRVIQIPGVVSESAVIRIIAVAEPSLCSGPTGVFPLGGSGQSICMANRQPSGLPLGLSQLGAVFDGLPPIDVVGWPIRVSIKVEGSLAHQRLIFSLRDFVAADPKATTDGHECLRSLVRAAVRFGGGAAHSEGAGVHSHQAAWRRIRNRFPANRIGGFKGGLPRVRTADRRRATRNQRHCAEKCGNGCCRSPESQRFNHLIEFDEFPSRMLRPFYPSEGSPFIASVALRPWKRASPRRRWMP